MEETSDQWEDPNPNRPRGVDEAQSGVIAGANGVLLRRASALALAQWVEQWLEAVVVDLLHQRQQAADLALGKTLAGEPVEVVAGQVGEQAVLVLAEGHG